MLLFGFVISLIYWIFSALSDMVIFGQGTFFENLATPSSQELIHRLSVVLVLIISSGYFRYLIGKRQVIENELDQEHCLSPIALNRIGAMAFVFDPTGKILRFNQTCEKITGYMQRHGPAACRRCAD